MLRLAAVVLVGLAALVAADVAAACTCADRDERDRLQDGEIAVLGRVLDRTPSELDPSRTRRYRYRVRVVRSANAPLRGEVELVVSDDGCGPGPWEAGERAAAFVRRRAGGWTVEGGCSIVDPEELARAFRPYPRPLGSGRVALLAAGRFGTARVMALDLRGRILGYGFGSGEVRQVSVCPGSVLATELVARGRELGVAVRALRSLQVVRYARLPVDARAIDPGGATVRCHAEDASSVHAEVRDYLQARRFDRVRLFRISGTAAEPVATVRGYSVALAPDFAYVADSERLSAVDLRTGASRRLSAVRAPLLLGVSPDHRLVALFDRDRLRLLDVLSGAEVSRKIRYGEELVWLAPDRFLFRAGGEARIYDTRLELLRRYRFFRAYGQALVGQRLFGTARFRLRTLLLQTGRRGTVSVLPDRGILDLVGVPRRPPVETERRAPELPWHDVRTMAGLGRTIPALPVRDIEAAVVHYRDRLGFTPVYVDDGFAVLQRDDARVHLWQAADRSWSGREDLRERPVDGAESFLAGTASCRIETEDVDGLYAELTAADVLHPVSRDGVTETDFGTREFAALDADGNLIEFFRWVR